MKVIDLPDDRRDLFCLCLEDWSEAAREAGPKRRQWLDESISSRGLRAKLALDDDGIEGGMIQYMPIENTHVEGFGLYFIYCIHVHGYRQGRGDHRGRGMGSALLEAAEEDARSLGAKGMAAWGLWLPLWMRASWFRKHGYRRADRQGIMELVWKPFTNEAAPPHWPSSASKLPEPVPGKVNLTAFSSGWCLARNLTCERAKRVAAEFGDSVSFIEIDTSTKEAVAEWGRVDDVLLDGRSLQKGPPPSCDKIRKAMAKRVARLGK